MRLDRNTNADGTGKYALINLRTDKVCWGGDDQFFVIKYKDKFAGRALREYARAVEDESNELRRSGKAEEADSLLEFATEMYHEATIADAWPEKKIPD